MKYWIPLPLLAVILFAAILFAAILVAGCAGNSGNHLPAFCKIRFGVPETSDTIFAYDKNTLLVYRTNDLASSPEKYPMRNGILIEGTPIPPFNVGAKTFTVTKCNLSNPRSVSEPSLGHSLSVTVTVQDGETQFEQYCSVVAKANRDQPLNYAHFDGTLCVVQCLPSQKPLVVGGAPTDLRVSVGSFDESAGCWTVVKSGINEIYAFPEDVTPLATVEFPSEDPESPIVKQFPLNQFC